MTLVVAVGLVGFFLLVFSSAVPPLVAVVSLVASFVAALAVGFVLARARARGLASVAASIGLSPRGPLRIDGAHALSTLGPFCIGHTRTATEHFAGTLRGVRVELFDYAYTVGTGNARSHRQRTAIVCAADGLALPTFVLGPENALERLRGALGTADHDFPSHPEFSRLYKLVGLPEADVRRVFAPAVLEILEAHAGLDVDGAGERFVVHHDGQLSLEAIPRTVTTAVALANAFVAARRDAAFR